MVHHIHGLVGGRHRGGRAWRDAGGGRAGWWRTPTLEDPEPDALPRVSLARKIEQSPHPLGRLACWLFIKGGIVTVLLLVLIGLGLIAVVLPH
jgi:hypothetical protein